MRLRAPGEKPPYSITHSELFEASYFALERSYPAITDAYDLLEWSLERTPWEESEPSPAFAERHLRLTLTPKMARFPGLRVLIEINDEKRSIHFWTLAVR